MSNAINCSVTESSWKFNFINQIYQRNSSEGSFKLLFETYKKVLNEGKVQMEENTKFKSEINDFEKENKKLKEEVESYVTSGASSTISNSKVKELEEKVYNLQEELTASFRNKSEIAQTLLEYTKDLKNVKVQLKETKAKLEEFQLENKKLRDSNSQLAELRVKNASIIEVLSGERDALQKDVEKKEKEILRLTKDNDELIERLVLQKQKEVDAMNQVNDLSISVQKQKEELAEAKQKYKFSAEGSGYFQVKGTGSGMGSFSNKNSEEKMIVISAPSKRSKRVNTDSDVYCCEFNSTGSCFGIACDDKTVKIYDADSFQLKSTFYGSTADSTHVAFSPNGKFILGTSTDAACRIWEINTGRSKHTLTGHAKKIQSADFTSDSSKVITGSNDRTIKIWEMVHGTCLKTILCQSTCNDLEVAKASDIIGSAHFDNSVRFWDPRAGKLVQMIKDLHQQQVTSLAFTKDGYHLLTNGRDNVLKYIDLRNYKTIHTLQNDNYKNGLNYNQAGVSPCGSYAGVGSQDGTIYIWNLMKGKIESTLTGGHQTTVSSVVWSPDGLTMATGGLDKSFCIWQ